MNIICNELHQLFASKKRYNFPFNESEIPSNGIYILFEKGEIAHNTERIVRVGTHTGNSRLVPRLKEHFLKEKKDRSIFRKNIGRAILSKSNDNFLEQWNWDLTSRENKNNFLPLLDTEKQKKIEKRCQNTYRSIFHLLSLKFHQKMKDWNWSLKLFLRFHYARAASHRTIG